MRLTLFISLVLIVTNSIAQDTLLLGQTIGEVVFEDEKEAMRFWLAVGISNMGKGD